MLAVFFAAGCGGTPDHALDDGSGDIYAQSSGGAISADESKSIASSFTVNSTDNFNGFNPDEWNNQQSWVECNCGDKKAGVPQIMTWNPDA